MSTKTPIAERGRFHRLQEARNARERCPTVAGEGPLCRGTRCTFTKAHRGAHVFGCCEYERAALREAGFTRVIGELETFDWDRVPEALRKKLGIPAPA